MSPPRKWLNTPQTPFWLPHCVLFMILPIFARGSGLILTTSHRLFVPTKEMLVKGSKINLCDPWINKDEITKEIAAGKYSYFADPYKSAWLSHVIICITPWEDLKKLDFRKIASLMASPKIFFDARNYFSNMKDIIEDAGIKYIGVGR